MLTACSGGSGESAAGGGEAAAASASTDASPTGPAVSALSTEELARTSLKELEAYWTTSMPQVFAGQEYKPLAGGYQRYTSTDVAGLGVCGGTYEDVANNAFYCPSGDLVAWDETDGAIVPKNRQALGDFSLGLIMAHELGHVIQNRVGFDTSNSKTVTGEQQADCYAGAWTASAANGGSPTFRVNLADLDNALVTLIDIADQVGSDASGPDAHGSAFDRVAAFQDGVENGLGACAAYTDASVAERLVQVPFTDAVDQRNNGNLPFDQAVQDTYKDLDDFWTTVISQNGATWAPQTDLPVDQALLRRLYDGAGDFAAATMIGHEYARKVQEAVGVPGTELAKNLQADCFTGVWASSAFLQDRPSSTFALSPGDLDEAVKAMLLDPASAQGGDAKVGTPFMRVDAFRTGFLKGFDACLAFTDDGSSGGSASPTG